MPPIHSHDEAIPAASFQQRIRGRLQGGRVPAAVALLLTMAVLEFLSDKTIVRPYHFTQVDGKIVSANRSFCASVVFRSRGSSSGVGCQTFTNEKLDQGSKDSHSSPLNRITNCTWTPDNSTECEQALQEVVCDKNDLVEMAKVPRILYIGDSVMAQLYTFAGVKARMISPAKKQLMEKTNLLQCLFRNTKNGRCNLNDQYGLSYPPNKTWIHPDTLWAKDGILYGPAIFGLKNPFCQDCVGCSPMFLECSLRDSPTTTTAELLNVANLTHAERINLVYGGFVGMEFARDVEMQSDRFLTTQENVAFYLQEKFNSPGLRKYWQQPTCIVNSGHHDAALPNMTKELYLENVRWFLHLLASECRSILWLATNAPKTNTYVQKIETTKTWGWAVRDMMQQDELLLRTRALYIDIFEASVGYLHRQQYVMF